MSVCNDLTAFFDGELEPGRAAAFRDHLAKCEACSGHLLGEMQLSAVVAGPAPQVDIASRAEETSSLAVDAHSQPEESTQPGEQLPDVDAGTIALAAGAAFYRELALVQIYADALLSALDRQDQPALEGLAHSAVATWRVAKSALQLLQDHDGETGKAELGPHALGASRRLLLHILGRVRAASAEWKFNVSRLHKVLQRLSVVLEPVAGFGQAPELPPGTTGPEHCRGDRGPTRSSS